MTRRATKQLGQLILYLSPVIQVREGVQGGGSTTGGGGERLGRGRVCTHSASVTEEVCVAPPTTEQGISQGGDPAGLKLGAGWVEVALARRQTMGWPHIDNTAETEVGVVEDPPGHRQLCSRIMLARTLSDQVRAIEGRERTSGSG